MAADQIEEVFPFTFAVTFDGTKEYHFQGRLEIKCLSESHGWVKIYEGESITITF